MAAKEANSHGISGCTNSQRALYLDPELQPLVIGRYRGIHATWLFSFYICEVVRAASLYSHVVGTFRTFVRQSDLLGLPGSPPRADGMRVGRGPGNRA